MTFEDVESARKKYRNRCLISIAIALAAGIFVLDDLRKDGMVMGWVALVLAGIIIYFITKKPREEYHKAYKEYFVLRSLKGIFTDLTYEPNKGLPSSVIASTGMMNMGDVYTSNDLIVAKYKNVGFTQADVHIQEEHETTDSDGNTTTYYVTIFKGRWMVFDFNKTFKANVQVAQKGFGNNRVKKKGLFTKKNDQSVYSKVEMESEEFNKRFKTYAQSAHEAFYILTPQLMEKIERLDDNNSGKLLLCFINNKLHIGLYDSKDSFEAPTCMLSLHEEKELNKMNQDIKTITQFIDELSLDNTLFKKEEPNQSPNVVTPVNNINSQTVNSAVPVNNLNNQTVNSAIPENNLNNQDAGREV